MSSFTVNRNELLFELGFSRGKIPADVAIADYEVLLTDQWTRHDANPKRMTFKVFVKPSERVYDRSGRPRKSSSHRVYLECPHCDKLIPFGRIGQHMLTRACRRYANLVKSQ